VSPSHQRQGLGRLLCSAQYEWMRAQGCRGAIGLAWQHGRADASAPLFRDAGFELLAELPDYYLEGSRNDGHSCPVCGGECHCTALLFGTLW
jgi:L-amino acid N-acyltransferase YncA